VTGGNISRVFSAFHAIFLSCLSFPPLPPLRKQLFSVLSYSEKLTAVTRLWTMDLTARNSTYTILDRHARQARFLTFAPTAVDDAVELQLHISDIDTAPPYRALSYVWGDRTITDPILLDGVNVQVTKNLRAALQAIRGHYTKESISSEPGYIWIDAICI
jgi:hypothetical protein